MKSLTIQKASIRYAAEIWEDIQTSFVGAHSEYIPTGQLGFKSYLEDYIESGFTDGKVILVALQGKDLVAFADIDFSSDKHNFLTRIGVKKTFRGEGIASQFMTRISHEMGRGLPWELDVLEENASALKLYLKYGFEIVTRKQWVVRYLNTDVNGNSHCLVNEEYGRYGFTSSIVADRRIGIVGNILRCNSAEDFLDESFIARAQQEYPFLEKAYCIVDSAENLCALDKYEKITSSYRMTGYFD